MSKTIHTVRVTNQVYDEIAKKLEEAGFTDCYLEYKGERILDMRAFGLLREVPDGGALFLVPPDTKTDIRSIIRQRIFPYYLEKCERHPKLYTLSPPRMDKGVARFKECLKKVNGDYRKAEQLMAIAIDNLSASDFHMGRKPGQPTRYNDWIEHLFKSTEKLEQWLNAEARA